MDFALIGTALAQGQAPAAQPSTAEMLVIPLVCFFIFYILIFKPQSKKHKEQQALLASLKAGDEIVTSGGIIGRVKSVAETFITIDAGGTTLKIVKEHVLASTKQTQAPVPAK
jgi:preprotein translocase subunit YajC